MKSGTKSNIETVDGDEVEDGEIPSIESLSTKSENDRANIQELIGTRGIILNTNYLVNLVGVDFGDAVINICDKVKQIIDEVSRITSKTVWFTIGKSSVTRKRRPRKNAYIPIKSTKPSTWKRGKISSRWAFYRSNEYQGLIVLACSTNKLCELLGFGTSVQEDYALALEQAVTHRFRWIEKNPNILNSSSSSGSQSNSSVAAGGIIYVAIKI